MRAAAAAAVGSVLALLLQKYTPELSLVVAVATSTVIVWISATVAHQAVSLLHSVAQKGEISSIYIAPVLKCIGIGLVTHLASQISKDAQQGSVAAAVELCGTLCALFISLPLIESLFSTVEKLL